MNLVLGRMQGRMCPCRAQGLEERRDRHDFSLGGVRNMSPNVERQGESATARTGVLGSLGASASVAPAVPWPP